MPTPAPSTYTYLLADPASAEGVLIDPVFSQHGRERATGCAIGLAERAGLRT